MLFGPKPLTIAETNDQTVGIVPPLWISGVMNGLHVVRGADHALGEEQAGGQLDVLPGAAHEHCERLVVDQEMKRRLHRDVIDVTPDVAGGIERRAGGPLDAG